MSSQIQPVPTPKWMFVTGWIFTILALAVLGVFVWLGLVLREERLRALLPFRSIR